MRDLFSNESLAVRRAKRSKKRGDLEWEIVDSHEPASYIDYLLKWSDYIHRTTLSGQRGYVDLDGLDPETEALIKTCNLVQCDLMSARYYERSLGIRFTRSSVVACIKNTSFSKQIKQAYSYGLVYLLLEREAVVRDWD